MAKTKKFKWLRPDEFPRQGPPLLSGKVYDSDLFPSHVVEEWIRTGAAKAMKEKPDVEPAEPTETPIGGENGNANDAPKKTSRSRGR